MTKVNGIQFPLGNTLHSCVLLEFKSMWTTFVNGLFKDKYYSHDSDDKQWTMATAESSSWCIRILSQKHLLIFFSIYSTWHVHLTLCVCAFIECNGTKTPKALSFKYNYISMVIYTFFCSFHLPVSIWFFYFFIIIFSSTHNVTFACAFEFYMRIVRIHRFYCHLLQVFFWIEHLAHLTVRVCLCVWLYYDENEKPNHCYAPWISQ